MPVVRTAYLPIGSIFNRIDLNCRNLNRCRIILAPCVMRCALEAQTSSTVPTQATRSSSLRILSRADAVSTLSTGVGNPFPAAGHGGAAAESVPRGDEGIAPYACWVDTVEGIGAMAGASPRPTMWQGGVVLLGSMPAVAVPKICCSHTLTKF